MSVSTSAHNKDRDQGKREKEAKKRKPFDPVHHLHVEGNDHALLFGGTDEGLGDGCSSSKGDDNDVVLVGDVENGLDLIVRCGPDDGVWNSLKRSVSQIVDLLLFPSATSHQPSAKGGER